MVHRVELAGGNVAKVSVHRPRPYTLGNLLVATQRIAFVGIEVAVRVVAVGDVSERVHLLNSLCLHGGHAGNE